MARARLDHRDEPRHQPPEQRARMGRILGLQSRRIEPSRRWSTRGLIASEDAAHHPRGHVLARAIGVGARIAVDVVADSVEPGDRFLLCSDGLSGPVQDDELGESLSLSSPADAVEALLARALGRGAPDNVTAIVIAAQHATRLTLADAGEEAPQRCPGGTATVIGDPWLDFALVGLEPSGAIDMLVPSRAAFEQQLRGSRDGVPITDLGNNRYRLQLDLNHQGWSGLLLVTGKGPFDPAVIASPLGARDVAWRTKLVERAAEQGWQTDMIWFRSVDDAKD